MKDPATGRCPRRLLIELAAVQRAQPGGHVLSRIVFDGTVAELHLRRPDGEQRARVPLTADRTACHVLLGGSRYLTAPPARPCRPPPVEETARGRLSYADLLHDLGLRAEGLSSRGHLLRYFQIGFDGAVADVVVVNIENPHGRYRSIFDVTHSSGPPINVPYAIAAWISDGHGTPGPDGVLERVVLA
ncbi:hypothetical protein, partial [Parafrankia soli]|uniref:hypothetical protein n=1 Tax=Parafrankia soli TaxID=2599596 RepID=UPI0010427412